MPSARPFWKGYLKLSLVSCPIALYPASSSSERVSFRQINKKTGHRLKQQLVDSVTGEVVESGDKGRGYEIGGNEFMQVEDEELDNLALESTHTIELQNNSETAKAVSRGGLIQSFHISSREENQRTQPGDHDPNKRRTQDSSTGPHSNTDQRSHTRGNSRAYMHMVAGNRAVQNHCR